MKIVTGIGENPHVTSKEFREIMEGVLGQGSYILTSGSNMSPELVSNNLLRINSGAMAHHGNISTVEVYDEVEILNGAQGVKRIDLVINRYRKDANTEIESNEWIVIQGTPATDNPVMPEYTAGNMQEGDLVDDCPVFAIHLDGLAVTEVKQLLDTAPNIDALKEEITILNNKLPFTESSLGFVTLSYYNTQWLKGTVKLDKEYSKKAKIITSIQYVEGTAINSSNFPTLSAEVNGNTLTIWASGGFVEGHYIEVAYLIVE